MSDSTGSGGCAGVACGLSASHDDLAHSSAYILDVCLAEHAEAAALPSTAYAPAANHECDDQTHRQHELCNNPHTFAPSPGPCTIKHRPAPSAATATASAGILGSRGQNKGIVGMYPNVQLFCLKVLGASGQGTMGTVVTALTWVAENGRDNNIRVVNLSLSGEPNDEVCEAITAVVKQGITVVAAAGNNGKDMSHFAPGNCKDALVVTAMTDFDGREGGRRGFDANSGEVDDTAASFSNYAGKGRPSNMVAAPGNC